MSIFLKQNVCRSPVSYIFYNCRRGQGGHDGLDYDTSMLYSHTHTHTYIKLMALCAREGEVLNLTLGCMRVPVLDEGGGGVEV